MPNLCGNEVTLELNWMPSHDMRDIYRYAPNSCSMAQKKSRDILCGLSMPRTCLTVSHINVKPSVALLKSAGFDPELFPHDMGIHLFAELRIECLSVRRWHKFCFYIDDVPLFVENPQNLCLSYNCVLISYTMFIYLACLLTLISFSLISLQTL